jgi:GNAT superfamily N-acetyltransferase
MGSIARLSADGLLAARGQLADLLVDAVEGGASLGFLAPLDPTSAATWWESQVPALADGDLTLWAARDGDRVSGTVSLRRERLPTGRHRAFVGKLMVRRADRGRGIARGLLAALESEAAATGVSLLVLDTETGSAAERLYRAAGWTVAGTVPGYAADPSGALRSSTFYFKTLSIPAGGRSGLA